MPKISARRTAERSNHGVGCRLDVDVLRLDLARELFALELGPREDLLREELDPEVVLRLVPVRLLDEPRLIVLRLAIAQMFSYLDPIIPQPSQNEQPAAHRKVLAIRTCLWYNQATWAVSSAG